jgi:hypothetical protein
MSCVTRDLSALVSHKVVVFFPSHSSFTIVIFSSSLIIPLQLPYAIIDFSVSSTPNHLIHTKKAPRTSFGLLFQKGTWKGLGTKVYPLIVHGEGKLPRLKRRGKRGVMQANGGLGNSIRIKEPIKVYFFIITF